MISRDLIAQPAGPPRRVFFSFHYQRDIWRVNVVRNHWIAKDTNPILSSLFPVYDWGADDGYTNFAAGAQAAAKQAER